MKIKTIGSVYTVMSNPYGKHKYFGWPTLSRLKNRKIALAASGFRLGHLCPFGKAVLGISEDGGETFSPPAVVIDTPLDDRDAGLCPFGESGLIVTSFNNTRAMQRSWREVDCTEEEIAYNRAYLSAVSDEEETEFLGATFRISRDNGVTFGPIFKSRITSPHGPVELRDGRILWVGRSDSVFGNDLDRLEAHILDPKNGKTCCIGFIEDIFDSEGKKLLSCEPYVIELEDGRLICHIRTEPNFYTYQSESEDRGVTWSAPHPLLEPKGGAASHIMQHSSGILVASYTYREKPFGIKIMLSSDGGNSWETQHRIYTNEISGDMGYPSTVELEDGSLLTAFYARENSRTAVIMAQKWSIEEQ